MIRNQQLRIPRGTGSFGASVEQQLGGRALRWYIAQIHGDEAVVEATLVDQELPELEPVAPSRPGRSVVASIIPTGVGCDVGGYAGDAAPITRLLSRTADYLVTNPNAVNASNFISLDSNVLYTEGLALDRFVKGQTELHVPVANRVGLIIEATSRARLETVYNVVNTVRAVHGVDIVACEVTDGPIGSRCVLNRSGAYVGTVDHPDQIHRATQRLINRGAQAIAVTTDIQDLPHDDYVRHFEGRFPNPMGGVEAIISHLIVHRHGLPAAHAPMINLKDLALEQRVVDARGAAEMASESGLACVLIGLSKAPQLRRSEGPNAPRIVDSVSVHNLLAVVTPAGCLGGIPSIYAARQGVPIVAVRDNRTVLDVTAEKMSMPGVIEVASYAEAAGILLALRHGLAIDSLSRPLATLRPATSAATGTGTVPPVTRQPAAEPRRIAQAVR
ncbi:MAG: DUF3326 domain-containing protein [Acidobacteriota bacterium]